MSSVSRKERRLQVPAGRHPLRRFDDVVDGGRAHLMVLHQFRNSLAVDTELAADGNVTNVPTCFVQTHNAREQVPHSDK